MDHHIGYIMTVSNSIIGVSILAMPYCFKQCGIILAICMLLLSGMISRLTCHYLLKSATMARRRTFELLSFHIFGTMGKLIVELGIIGFLMGTCVAFFVIIGDLGPAILAKVLRIENNDSLRTTLLICVALFCVLPLGLLKNVESLSSVSTATIGFYFCLVLKTIAESAAHFTSDDWASKVDLWKPHGILQCLPIFAMALSCQTQLFEIYETLPNASLEKMNYVVRSAVNICVCVYISVGFFGYVAFVNYPFTGNILMSFSQSVMTDAMKIGFVLSVACSFPLVIFPCRASLYSLLFKKGYTPYEGTSNFIPESRFKFLTIFIVTVSLIIGIIIPNIEVVLGLLGSTIGTMICVIFPVTCFICISTKNTNERILAQIMLFVGVIMMVLGTYANLYAMEEISTAPAHMDRVHLPPVNPIIETNNVKNDMRNKYVIDIKKGKVVKNPEFMMKQKEIVAPPVTINQKQYIDENLKEIRKEPPQPEEPLEEKFEKIKEPEPPLIKIEEKTPIKKENPPVENIPKIQNEIKTTKMVEVDKQAIEKEENELKEEAKINKIEEDKNAEDILRTLEKHKEEQKNLIQQHKQILEEIKKETKELKDKHLEDRQKDEELRLKAANQIVEIAKIALESLGPQNDEIKKAEKIVENLNQKPTNNTEEKPKDTKPGEVEKLIIKSIKSENKLNENQINKILPNNATNVINSQISDKKMVPLPILVRDSASKMVENNLKEVKTLENNVLANKVYEPIENKVEAKETSKVHENKIQNEPQVKEISLIDKKDNNLVNKDESKVEKINLEENKVDPKIGRDILENKESNLDKSEVKPETINTKISEKINEISIKPTEKILETKNDLKENPVIDNKNTVSKIGRDILGEIVANTEVNLDRKKREVENIEDKVEIVTVVSDKDCAVTEGKGKPHISNVLMSLSHNVDILKDNKNILHNMKFTENLMKNHENLRRRK